MPRERIVSDAIIRWLRGHGCYVIKMHGDAMQERGLPDIWFCWRGRFGVVETKRPRHEPSPLQRWHLEQIEKAGGLAFVAHSLAELQEAFRIELLEAIPANA